MLRAIRFLLVVICDSRSFLPVVGGAACVWKKVPILCSRRCHAFFSWRRFAGPCLGFYRPCAHLEFCLLFPFFVFHTYTVLWGKFLFLFRTCIRFVSFVAFAFLWWFCTFPCVFFTFTWPSPVFITYLIFIHLPLCFSLFLVSLTLPPGLVVVVLWFLREVYSEATFAKL